MRSNHAPGDVLDAPLDPPESPYEDCPHDPRCDEDAYVKCQGRQARDANDDYDAAMESKWEARHDR